MKQILIKIGTKILTTKENKLDLNNLRKLSNESGEAVIVLGTRKAESSNRAQSISRFENIESHGINKVESSLK